MSSRIDSEFLLLNTIKRISTEYDHYENSTETIQAVSNKLYQIWMRPQILSNFITRNKEGFHVVEYLEQLISDNKMNDNFFILIINTLVKNENFYQVFLNDHKRFKQLFSSSNGKPVYLTRLVFFD
jgi:hypothetical protein